MVQLGTEPGDLVVPKVWNKRHKGVPTDAVYVGRPTKGGNPYSHLPSTKAEFTVTTREEAVEQYREWLLTNTELIEAAKTELKDRDLVCWCAPKSCHADILMEIANS